MKGEGLALGFALLGGFDIRPGDADEVQENAARGVLDLGFNRVGVITPELLPRFPLLRFKGFHRMGGIKNVAETLYFVTYTGRRLKTHFHPLSRPPEKG